MAGHSAGSIFLANFLNTLHKDVTVKSAHFLAPAISNESFKETFAPAVDGKRVGKLHVFAMKKVHELNDTTTPLYRKSTVGYYSSWKPAVT